MPQSHILRRERDIFRQRKRRLRQAREDESQAYLKHGLGSSQQLAAAEKVERRKAAMISAARSVGAIERSEDGRERTDVESVARQAEEEDRPRAGTRFHRVEGYRKDDGERVRPHLAHNPRRRRQA
jgi:hypothetical protein